MPYHVTASPHNLAARRGRTQLLSLDSLDFSPRQTTIRTTDIAISPLCSWSLLCYKASEPFNVLYNRSP